MPAYDYTAIDANGAQIKGVLVADDEPALVRRLREEGAWLLSSSERRVRSRNRQAELGPRLRRRVLIEFTMQLAILVRAGVPLSQALEQLQSDAVDPRLARVIGALRLNVNSGVELSTALAQFPRTFPDLYVELVRAGEQSGNLQTVLFDLQAYLEWVDKLVAQARQATTYPMLVGVAIMILVIILFTFVVPQFINLLQTLNVALPLPTRIVMGISEGLKGGWWLLLAAGVVIPATVHLLNRFSPRFAYGYEQLKLGLPLFGALRRKLALSRFSRNFALLFKSGISVIDCMQMLPGLVGNRVVAGAVQAAGGEIAEGGSVAESFARHDVIEPLVIRMLAVGETTGELSSSLEQAALYYEEEIPRAIQRFFSLLEPTLIIFMVALVGFVALAIMLPLMSLLSAVG